ncbi:hypothetical protein J6Z37_01550 [Candidatus Saccharibacteria bacterium]|nr:hypothetical protein [Candidatus Saccharibacteria bacterium]
MQEMSTYLSEDGKTVVVLRGDNEEQFSVDEFVEIYGEDALPIGKLAGGKIVISEEAIEEATEAEEEHEKKEMENIKKYYHSFLDFLDAVGAYNHLSKLQSNAAAGVPSAQEVVYNYGYSDKELLGKKIIQRQEEREWKLRLLDHWSQQVGYLPMGESGMKKVMKFAEDATRRRWLRENLKRAKEKGCLLSVADLMAKRYQIERKQRDKKGGGGLGN